MDGCRLVFTCIALLLGSITLQAQDDDSLYFQFEPDSLDLAIGDSANVKITLFSEDSSLSNNQFLITGAWGAVEVRPWISNQKGVANVQVKVFKPGSFKLSASSITPDRFKRVRGRMPITVPFPPIAKAEFIDPPRTAYEGTTIEFAARVLDQANITRQDVQPVFKSSNPEIADFDEFGHLTIYRRGLVQITVTAEGISSSTDLRVVRNPVRKIELSLEADDYRTGDVITFKARALTASGRAVEDAPVVFSFMGKAVYGIGLPASGQITLQGKFVAENPGDYTIFATSGGHTASKTIRITPRNIQKRAKLVGHGLITDVFTSDLWVWQGVGEFKERDFAVTGTWEANGEAYFWEVTDPSNMIIIDTVTVDARTVNDVKISADGRIGVLTREGASTRKNGVVILDVSNPYDVKILSEFNDGLTGGVHNAFIYDNHIYAVNNGRKYDIINISDPENPWRVGSYELNTPGHSIHDVWVENGIAYSSNWNDGVHIFDIGGLNFSEQNRHTIMKNPVLQAAGKGSPRKPTLMSSKTDTTGRNHAAFPFLSKSTGNFYVIAGDEHFPFGLGEIENMEPANPRGGYHFLNMNDYNVPVEEAIYQVPEAGSHNLWVKGDTLYTAFYQGGLRVVDISGELLGDLYKQGREIAFYLSNHKNGRMSNATMVWGPQPYKNHIFFSDMNSGLYAVQLVEYDYDEDDE
ncbi:MAG TPA: hypothetical protein EYM74_04290 [Candidatus Marinimicrobia bacterium]|nr:hypothetical protein [Candidatus Neomarinimicrobiota bacterium]